MSGTDTTATPGNPTLLDLVGARLTFHRSRIKGEEILLLSNNPHISSKIEAGEFYEQQMLDWIARNETFEGCVYDIGANIANHSIYAGKFLGDRHIVAFEPVYAALYNNNMHLNRLGDRFTFFNIGLGPDEGERGVVVRGGRYNPGATDLVAGSGITVKPLDSLDLPPPGLLKIDVEGMEIGVLQGGKALIERHRPLLYVEVDTKGDRLAEFTAYLDSIGYVLSHRFNATPTYRCLPREKASAAA